MEETKQDLLQDLQIDTVSPELLENLVNASHKYVRDLRMNLKSIYKSKVIDQKEANLIALSIAVNNSNDLLIESYTKLAKDSGASKEEIADATACASLLSANNVLYRFRHFVEKDYYNTARAGLRMNIMMTPVLGKELFELISLAVSAVNGCEMCVKSHEASVLEAGGSEERIWDAVKIASVVTSACKIF